MALHADLVGNEVLSAPGTGTTITLGASATGFRSFLEAEGAGDVTNGQTLVPVTIASNFVDGIATRRETATVTYNTGSPATLTNRTTIRSNNGNNPIDAGSDAVVFWELIASNIPAPSSGIVEAVDAGENILVDDTDPANPVVALNPSLADILSILFAGTGENPFVLDLSEGDTGYEYGIGRSGTTRSWSGLESLSFHLNTGKSLSIFSSGWDQLFELRGGSGDARFKNSVTIGDDEAYGPSWEDNPTVPQKGALFDKFEAMSAASLPPVLSNDPGTTTGLDYGYQGGVISAGGNAKVVVASTVTLPDDTVSSIYFDTNFEVVAITSEDGWPAIPNTIPMATVTTVGGAITSIVDRRGFLFTPLGEFSRAVANGLVRATGGLSISVESFNLFGNEGYKFGPIGSPSLTDDALNYVEATQSGDIVANTTGFTAGNLPLALVETAGGEVTSVSDSRTPWVSFDLGGAPDTIEGEDGETGGEASVLGGDGSVNEGGAAVIVGGDGATSGGGVEIVGGEGDDGTGGTVEILPGAGSTDGGDVYIELPAAGSGRQGLMFAVNFPTSDPLVANALYVDGDTIKISAGPP